MRLTGSATATQVKLFSFFEELAEPVRKQGSRERVPLIPASPATGRKQNAVVESRLVQTAWRSRGKLVHDVKAA